MSPNLCKIPVELITNLLNGFFVICIRLLIWDFIYPLTVASTSMHSLMRVGLDAPNTHHSMTSYGTFLDNNLISWSAKKQPVVSWSSTKAKYYAMGYIATELTWLSFIIRNLGVCPPSPPTRFCDNLSVLRMTINLVLHARSKHIELDYHYVHKHLARGLLHTKHVSFSFQLADIFTKALSKHDLSCFWVKLCLVHDQLWGGVLKEIITLTPLLYGRKSSYCTRPPSIKRCHLSTNLNLALHDHILVYCKYVIIFLFSKQSLWLRPIYMMHL